MWRLADRQLDEFDRPTAAASSSARTRSPSRCSWSPTSSAFPKRSTSGSAHGFGLSANPGELGRRSERHGDERARMARRLLRHVHRGTPSRAARRRPHRPGAREVPRRIDARRDRRSCARPRSCSPPARRRRRACSPPSLKYLSRVSRAPGRAPRAPRPHPGVRRGGAAASRARSRPTSVSPGGRRRSAASRSRRARR